MSAECKRRKEAIEDPNYVPEDEKKKSNKISKKKAAEEALGVVSFVFILFFVEFIYYLMSFIYDEYICYLKLFII